MNPGLLLWLAKLLWRPKRTHELLGLPRPISARVLEVLDELQDDRTEGIADQIWADAHQIFSEALQERHVPSDVYDLVTRHGSDEHRVIRPFDGCTWSLFEFDDFIDLGLNQSGAPRSDDS